MAGPIITLLTDFGLGDVYVASLKGAILSINAAATIVDVTHDVRPQGVEQGAFLLSGSWPYFPAGSIHVAVVDPGVGSERKALALRTPAGLFLGPDNGILSAALPDDAREAAAGLMPLPAPHGLAAHALTDERFHRLPVSATFHGRDIFAPAAAHLSLGVPLAEMGPRVEAMLVLPPFRAVLLADGSLSGRVMHVDRFGNLITNVRAEQLATLPRAVVEVCGRRIGGVRAAYAEGGGLLAVIGSSGFLEVALREGSAARELGADIGEPVAVRRS